MLKSRGTRVSLHRRQYRPETPLVDLRQSRSPRRQRKLQHLLQRPRVEQGRQLAQLHWCEAAGLSCLWHARVVRPNSCRCGRLEDVAGTWHSQCAASKAVDRYAHGADPTIQGKATSDVAIHRRHRRRVGARHRAPASGRREVGRAALSATNKQTTTPHPGRPTSSLRTGGTKILKVLHSCRCQDPSASDVQLHKTRGRNEAVLVPVASCHVQGPRRTGNADPRAVEAKPLGHAIVRRLLTRQHCHHLSAGGRG